MVMAVARPPDKPELSERQQTLLAVLRDNSDHDPAGRLVSSWTQAQLAAKLGLSVRTLRRLLDDLREPDADPRHSTTDRPPPGRRLGLVKVEPILREPPGGGRLYAENLYVLADAWPVGPVGPVGATQQTPKPRRRAAARKPDPADATGRPQMSLWPVGASEVDPEHAAAPARGRGGNHHQERTR
jgi:hypothetical protein